MAFKFPFTNYHELNLTWVLEQLKKLFEDSEENVETIESYENRLSAVETELPVVEATANQAETVANAAATLAQTAKTTADTANENALTASAQAGLARQEADEAGQEAQSAIQAAQQVQSIVQDFDGRITQAEDDASEALQEAQSFENRVNAAINTANNAANTATIAQGIAVNANQNAATALDTAQTADGKAEAAQDAAEVADGKAEAAQDAADIADGKAEAAQDAADIADGKAEAAQDTADTNAANIGNLADLTTTAKNNLVAAINEAAQTGGSGTSFEPSYMAITDLLCPDFTEEIRNRRITKEGNKISSRWLSSNSNPVNCFITGSVHKIALNDAENSEPDLAQLVNIEYLGRSGRSITTLLYDLKTTYTGTTSAYATIYYYEVNGDVITKISSNRITALRMTQYPGLNGHMFNPPKGATHFALSICTVGSGPSYTLYFGLGLTPLPQAVSSVYHSYQAPARLYPNDLIMVWATLYKVTTQIAPGASLTPGTNITATTLTAELVSLLNS